MRTPTCNSGGLASQRRNKQTPKLQWHMERIQASCGKHILSREQDSGHLSRLRSSEVVLRPLCSKVCSRWLKEMLGMMQEAWMQSSGIRNYLRT